MQSRLSLVVPAVSLVAIGLAAYALTRAMAPPPAVSDPGPRVSLEDGLRELESRVADLEAVQPPAETTDIDPRILERLDDLDRRLKAMGALAPSAEAAPTDAPPEPAAAAGEPAEEDIERFRKLQAAAARQRRIGINAVRIDKVLGGLRITLTGEQRNRLVETYTAFEDRRNEIWGEAKRSGASEGPGVDWRRIIADTNEVIQREFTERISPFIPAGDAERISRSLTAGGK